jgi:hypothetical protein
MVKVGLIINPDAGKDIRRITSAASDVTDRYKYHIAYSIAKTLLSFENIDLEIMPERFGIGKRLLDSLDNGKTGSHISLVNMQVVSSAEDSTYAAKHFVQTGARLIIILGGDGTVRIVSKSVPNTPILAVSSGTNNVVPTWMEGTTAGLAAKYILSNPNLPFEYFCTRHKYFDVWIDGKVVDIALVDVGVIRDDFIGAKAVWSKDRISQVAVTRSKPLVTGLSSIVGMVRRVEPSDPYGVLVTTGEDSASRVMMVPLQPGELQWVGISEIQTLLPDQFYSLRINQNSVISLDGEKEIPVSPDQQVQIVLRINGPWIVDVDKVMEIAIRENYFMFGKQKLSKEY